MRTLGLVIEHAEPKQLGPRLSSAFGSSPGAFVVLGGSQISAFMPYIGMQNQTVEIMQNEEIPDGYWQLGRALFGAYNIHSGGLSGNGEPVPTWSEIAHREHEKAETHEDRRHEPRQDGVCAHWAYVACCSAIDADAAAERAQYLDAKYKDNEIYQRVTA